MPLAHFGGPNAFTCRICHTYVDSLIKGILFTQEAEYYFICQNCHNIKQRKEKLQKIIKK